MESYSLNSIGIIHSPYKEKFAIPRQPGLVTAAKAELELLPPYNHIDCIRGLEEFSHLWLSFIFHKTASQGWKPLVRPPRLGGNQKVGVFASRSTFRPNPLGLSVVKLEGVAHRGKTLRLQLSGIDLMDGTPIVDIKPYIPYADSITDAQGGFANEKPTNMPVSFSEDASRQIKELQAQQQQHTNLKQLIEQVLAQDPRPAYKGNDEARVYGVTLYNLNIQWKVINSEDEPTSLVIAIQAK